MCFVFMLVVVPFGRMASQDMREKVVRWTMERIGKKHNNQVKLFWSFGVLARSGVKVSTKTEMSEAQLNAEMVGLLPLHATRMVAEFKEFLPPQYRGAERDMYLVRSGKEAQLWPTYLKTRRACLSTFCPAWDRCVDVVNQLLFSFRIMACYSMLLSFSQIEAG